MSEWQPIETAPKDDAILIYDPDNGMEVAWWCEIYPLCAPVGGWVYGQYDSPISGTHWMPLPKPPAPNQPEDKS